MAEQEVLPSEPNDDNKWTSRKFIASTLAVGTMILLPVIYRKFQIADSITLLVLGCIASVTGVYNVANSLSKKYSGDSG